jgi:phosphoserine phosphatase RsbU/P
MELTTADFELFQHYTLRDVKAGEIIFRQGEHGDEMFVVLSGELQVTLNDNVINVLHAGSIFGEMSLVDEGQRSATITAVTNSALIPINPTNFNKLIQQHPEFATHVMRVMSIRLRQMMAEEVQRQRMEQELAIGRQIQLSLLPQQPPKLVGWEFATHYQAAREVGGDLYDFILDAHNPDYLNLLIADVTGKGVPAAMFMAVGRTLFRAQALTTPSPARLLSSANHLIHSDNRTFLLMSVFYARLNMRTGELIYATAGHETPLRLTADSGEVEYLLGRGILLGAFGTVHFEEKTAVLAPGDLLLLYTDGVTEARNARGEFFGEERLAAAVTAVRGGSATDLVNSVVTAVANFTGDTPSADDLTIVAVHRQP